MLQPCQGLPVILFKRDAEKTSSFSTLSLQQPVVVTSEEIGPG